MDVVLNSDVKGLGKKSEKVNVSDGYARNFLFPKKLAVEANATAMNELKNREEAKAHHIAEEKKAAEETERYIEETKYITDWCKENNPCPNCKINKKDHWDDIHYNCAENHHMRCPILKEYYNDRDELYNEYRERKKEENKNA